MKQIQYLLNFISKNENWKELLQQEPYNIKIKESGKYTLLKYSQLESDFNNKIVCTCRGLILNNENKIVCLPFYKFFNYGEQYADKIDWSSAKVQEKIDGSLIKLWYDEYWHISTNGNINAYTTPTNDESKTFGDLFERVREQIDFNKLKKENTYMFELVSPENQVIVFYPNTKIYHIGTRNNETYEEIEEDIGVEKPKTYSFNNLEDLIEFSKTLTKDEEGFVVVDKNYNRIKVKSPQYLMAHYLLGNCKFTEKRLLEIIKSGETGEILTYFPELQNDFDKINIDISYFIADVYNFHAKYLNIKDRKKYVEAIKMDNSIKCNLLFYFLMKLYDNPNCNIKLELLKLPIEKIKEVIIDE